jgi:mannose-6-phosphate isomerase-like protein (cupin superfamily)
MAAELSAISQPTASAAVVDPASLGAQDSGPRGVRVKATLGEHTGFAALEQSLLELDRGASLARDSGTSDEVLFVTSGRGTLHHGGEHHDLDPEAGVLLPAGTRYELENQGDEALRVVSVRIPVLDATALPAPPEAVRPVVRRVADQVAQSATTQREFRIVADPGCGLRSATQFVGYIPRMRAPDHFHTYDEVIYVLEGDGRFHAGETSALVAAGSCIQLPARTVHCLENTGQGTMRVLGVFRPAGSPAEAYYPDGTPAYTPVADATAG